MIFAAVAALVLPFAAHAEGCSSVAEFAQTIAGMRESGLDEDRVGKFVGQSIQDNAQLVAATALIHKIYNEPGLKAMTPDRTRKFFYDACVAQG